MASIGVNRPLPTSTFVAHMSDRPPRPNPRNPVHLLACGLGTGWVRHGPGTAGTALAVLVYVLLPPLSLTAYAALCVALSVFGIVVSAQTARDLNTPDHPAIVIDEVAGFLITMLALPPDAEVQWLWVMAGFVVFRALDIIKPWPIRLIDRRVHGGLGIMLDDIVAGLIAMTILAMGRYIYAGI